MTISRKSSPPLPNMCFNIGAWTPPLLQVDHYKYLGVWLSHDLSWAKQMCRNACKQVGILYRQFYGHSSPDCLRQLTCEIETRIAAPVWGPHQQTSIHKLEKVQKFALKVYTKLWTRDYTIHY